ncbi:unnamed protein product, partial [Amoebophrya sp. A25]
SDTADGDHKLTFAPESRVVAKKTSEEENAAVARVEDDKKPTGVDQGDSNRTGRILDCDGR